MPSNKNRIEFLNEISFAIAHLRNALQVAEDESWEDFYPIEEQIASLIDLSNLAEQIV